MLSLRAEIAACLFAVGLLGLLAGWMMQRSNAARRLRASVAAWEERHATLERNARRDAEHLEQRLQSLGEELHTLQGENRGLRDASQSGERTLDVARAEAIEANRRQAETVERLQRLLGERERELAALRAHARGADPSAFADDATPADALDATVRLDPSLLPGRRPSPSPRASTDLPEARGSTLERTLEATFLDDFEELEEATIALDEEALSRVRGRGRGEP